MDLFHFEVEEEEEQWPIVNDGIPNEGNAARESEKTKVLYQVILSLKGRRATRIQQRMSSVEWKMIKEHGLSCLIYLRCTSLYFPLS